VRGKRQAASQLQLYNTLLWRKIGEKLLFSDCCIWRAFHLAALSLCLSPSFPLSFVFNLLYLNGCCLLLRLRLRLLCLSVRRCCHIIHLLFVEPTLKIAQGTGSVSSVSVSKCIRFSCQKKRGEKEHKERQATELGRLAFLASL